MRAAPLPTNELQPTQVVTEGGWPQFSVTERSGGGREHRPERTRARLIDAAVSAFAERGYAATSVHDICARAQLSVGSFYYHFDDKASITLGIFESEHAVVTRRLEAIDMRRTNSIEETLNELLNGPRTPLYRALREASEVERDVAKAAAELVRVTQDGLVAAITRARQGGDRYRLKPRPIAWAFVAMTRAALAEAASNEPLAREIAEIVHYSVSALDAPTTANGVHRLGQ